MGDEPFFAHSGTPPQTMKEHLENVTEDKARGIGAAVFATGFEYEEEARLAGLLHDVGKYSNLFKLRLENKVSGLDHWSIGAWIALRQYLSVAAALAIQGHHVGLQKGDYPSLYALKPETLAANLPPGKRLTETNVNLLLKRLGADGIHPVSPARGLEPQRSTASAMLDVRMLFSALVDADFLDTERHMKGGGKDAEPVRPAGLALNPQGALKVLEDRLRDLNAAQQSSEDVCSLRDDLCRACAEAADTAGADRLFTLSAPTGSGKTLAMLLFALRQAVARDLRRIVVVLPYLSILDQTVRVYRDLFPKAQFGENYVVEHHSLARGAGGAKAEDKNQDAESESQKRARLLSENWDAPIVITTSVQFLESLFANRPSACRKLHRLARSVVLLDEVQTLPLPLAVPTLQTLSRLAHRYDSSVVFATATQPAFEHLDEHVRRDTDSPGWRPREIVPPGRNLYDDRARRTEVDWSRATTPTDWETVAGWIEKENQALCIVNLKRHALELAKRLKDRDVSDLYHLSTSMCPAHRKKVLDEISGRLKQKLPVRLISTQCVEAGVDVDFPAAFRAFGPLDSIAQAAGRCNRNGELKGADGEPMLGRVVVFLPDEEEKRAYPSGGYRQAADTTRSLLLEKGGSLDIHDPATFAEYFRRLYNIARPEMMSQELNEQITAQDYAQVAALYQVIEDDTVNVLVAYDSAEYERLVEEVKRTGLTRKWVQQARPYTVNLFRKKDGTRPSDFLEAVHLARNGEEAHDWFIYLEPGIVGQPPHYDPDFGLNPPAESGYYAA